MPPGLPGPYCGRCTDSPLDGCLAALAFSGEGEVWIHRFKYPASGLAGLDPAPRAVVVELGRYAAANLERAVGSPEWIVPVPLHARRLRARGFNPAAVIAREVADAVGARFEPRALARIRDTPSQTGLDRNERRRNIARAFRCRKRAARSIWLVDDVVTTGATLAEAARTLRRAGARAVAAVCAARTL